jgi:hypothetical protein
VKSEREAERVVSRQRTGDSALGNQAMGIKDEVMELCHSHGHGQDLPGSVPGHDVWNHPCLREDVISAKVR